MFLLIQENLWVLMMSLCRKSRRHPNPNAKTAPTKKNKRNQNLKKNNKNLQQQPKNKTVPTMKNQPLKQENKSKSWATQMKMIKRNQLNQNQNQKMPPRKNKTALKMRDQFPNKTPSQNKKKINLPLNNQKCQKRRIFRWFLWAPNATNFQTYWDNLKF